MIISGLILMVACKNESPSGQIDAMQKRVDAVERDVEVIYNQDFNDLVNEYKALDTTVALTKDIQYEMELLQAYLQQFEIQRVVIKEASEYSRKQLSDLQDDVKKHLYDEETTSKYIQDEEAELRTMEAQIKYFKEKFDEQKEVVKQLRKE
ncbi:MAG: hypothetical protein J6T53_01040 [Bacteroidales bacterium]|nr:hypothetical protein [Bacteroidales bacterium]